MGNESKVRIPEVLDKDGNEIGGKTGDPAGRYDVASLWNKIGHTCRSAGRELIFKVLCLYYALDNPAMPFKVKTTIYATIGYFVLPIDAIPDVLPLVGYTDDLAAIAAVLIMASPYVDDGVKAKAERKLKAWFD